MSEQQEESGKRKLHGVTHTHTHSHTQTHDFLHIHTQEMQAVIHSSQDKKEELLLQVEALTQVRMAAVTSPVYACVCLCVCVCVQWPPLVP